MEYIWSQVCPKVDILSGSIQYELPRIMLKLRLHIIVSFVNLELIFIYSVLHMEAVELKAILGLDLLAHNVVLSLELFGVSDYFLDVLLREAALFVSGGDLLGFHSKS